MKCQCQKTLKENQMQQFLLPSGMCDQSCFVLKISCNTDDRMALVTATTVYHPRAVNLLQNFRDITIFNSLPTYTLVVIVGMPTISWQNPNSKNFYSGEYSEQLTSVPVPHSRVWE